jgi:hypothetical protein
VSDDGYPSPPGATTTTWTKGSGPGTVTFQNAGAVDTRATFSAAGTYILRLTASDGALSTRDSVPDRRPAGQHRAGGGRGSNATIALPADLALDGTVSDDGYPSPPGTLTTTWSKGSGPGTVTFQNASAVDTRATFSVAGTYLLRLTANDGALSTSDSVQITVQPVNTAPVVDAGPNATIALPADLALDGTVSDDGYPSPPAALTTTWTKGSGPGTVTFQNAGAVDTRATFSVAGTYILRLTANDGALSTRDSVQITVQPVNTAPVVDAGPNATIALPADAALDGTVSDDGYPSPPAAVTTTWTQGSGPGTVTFQNASAIDTRATLQHRRDLRPQTHGE